MNRFIQVGGGDPDDIPPLEPVLRGVVTVSLSVALEGILPIQDPHLRSAMLAVESDQRIMAHCRLHGLSVDEAGAIHLYTQDWGPDEGLSIRTRLNEVLQTEDGDPVPWRPFVHLLLGGLAKLPPVTITAYCGVTGDVAEDAFPLGERVVRRTFTSVTPNQRRVVPVEGAGIDPSVVFTVEVHLGRDIQPLSAIPDEPEIVLPPGSSFECLLVTPSEQGVPMGVTLREVETHDDYPLRLLAGPGTINDTTGVANVSLHGDTYEPRGTHAGRPLYVGRRHGFYLYWSVIPDGTITAGWWVGPTLEGNQFVAFAPVDVPPEEVAMWYHAEYTSTATAERVELPIRLGGVYTSCGEHNDRPLYRAETGERWYLYYTPEPRGCVTSAWCLSNEVDGNVLHAFLPTAEHLPVGPLWRLPQGMDPSNWIPTIAPCGPNTSVQLAFTTSTGLSDFYDIRGTHGGRKLYMGRRNGLFLYWSADGCDGTIRGGWWVGPALESQSVNTFALQDGEAYDVREWYSFLGPCTEVTEDRVVVPDCLGGVYTRDGTHNDRPRYRCAQGWWMYYSDEAVGCLRSAWWVTVEMEGDDFRAFMPTAAPLPVGRWRTPLK